MPSHGDRRKGLAFLVLCIAQLMCLMDTSVVHIALPSIQEEFGLSTGKLQWVVTAYTLAYGGCLLLGGRLGDLLGRRRVMLSGLAGFVLGSLAAGLAPDGAVLVAARFVQGLGAAAVAPATIAFVATLFADGEPRHRALGVLGAVSSAGFSTGLILGGVVSATLGWRWAFLAQVPLGVVVWWMGARHLPPGERLRQPVDTVGAVLATSAIGLMVWALSSTDRYGVATGRVLSLLLLCAVLWAVLLVAEHRAPHPLFPVAIFRHRWLSGAVVASAAFGAMMGPTIFMLTLYLQEVRGLTPLMAGLAFLPQEMVVVGASALVGRHLGRMGVRRVLATGMLAFGASALWLAGIAPDAAYATAVLPGVVLVGVGVAAVIVAGAAAATAGVPSELQGLASGIWSTAPQVGTSLGLAVLVAVSQRHTALLLQSVPDIGATAAQVAGYRAAFIASVGFAAIGLAGVLAFIRHERAQAAVPVAGPAVTLGTTEPGCTGGHRS